MATSEGPFSIERIRSSQDNLFPYSYHCRILSGASFKNNAFRCSGDGGFGGECRKEDEAAGLAVGGVGTGNTQGVPSSLYILWLICFSQEEAPFSESKINSICFSAE